jgi:hypothetical protein
MGLVTIVQDSGFGCFVLGVASLASRCRRRNCVYKRACYPTVLFPFLFSSHGYLLMLSEYIFGTSTSSPWSPSLPLYSLLSSALLLSSLCHISVSCAQFSSFCLLSCLFASKHRSSAVAAGHSIRDEPLKFLRVYITVYKC